MMALTIHAAKTNRSRLIEHALGGEEAVIAAATSLRCERVPMAAPSLQPLLRPVAGRSGASGPRWQNKRRQLKRRPSAAVGA